ncbi:MAG TPA: hypothetical protein VJ874_05895 [Candidatus Thermoplasmatota archaeon]|nr:hypothetical protein [Candidatus Thermoplasmatota archaeon]
MRAWLPLPLTLLLMCTPVAMAEPVDAPSDAELLAGPAGVSKDCYIPYTGPDETHGNPFGGDEGFFIELLPAPGHDDGSGNQAGYGVGMTRCEIDPWDELFTATAAAASG